MSDLTDVANGGLGPFKFSNPTAPEEVEHDAVAELERLQKAQEFSPPPLNELHTTTDSYDFSMPSASSYSAPIMSPSRRADEVDRRDSTLEDVYSSFPKIGDGSHYLRVVRKSPATFGGRRTSGFLADVHGQLDMNEFARRFGGGSYDVSVIGPARGGALDADGNIRMRTLSSIKLDVMGPPTMISPLGDDVGGKNGDGGTRMNYGGAGAQMLDIRKLELEADEKRQQRDREEKLQRELLQQRQQGVSPNLISQIEQAAERRAADVKGIAAETIQNLRRQIERMNEQIDQKDGAIQQLREKMVQLQTDVALRLREEESKAVRDLKEHQERETSRLREEHARLFQSKSQDYERQVLDLSNRHREERDRLMENGDRERQRAMEDFNRRERQVLDDYQRREQSMRETYESRLTEQERSHDREIRHILDQRNREVESIKTTESSKSHMTDTAAKMQIEHMRNEIARTQVQIDAFQRENASLRDKLHKTPQEAIVEAHQLAQMTGMIQASEAGGGGGEEEGDWKKGLLGTLRTLVDKAPEIAEGFGRTREQNRLAAEQMERTRTVQMRAAQAAHQQQQAIQQQQFQAAQSPQQMAMLTQQRQRRMVPPPPGVSPMPPVMPVPGMSGAPQSPRPMFSGRGPRVSPPPMTAGYVPPAAVSPLASDASATPIQPMESDASMNLPEPEPANFDAVPPRRNALVAVPQEQLPSQELAITEEQMNEFAEKLNGAIESDGLITPSDFAKGFVEKVGVDAARALLQQIQPEQFVAAIASHPAGAKTAIATLDGRKYVQEMWQNVLGIVGT